MSVLCYMSLSLRCGRVCSCERAWCVLSDAPSSDECDDESVSADSLESV